MGEVKSLLRTLTPSAHTWTRLPVNARRELLLLGILCISLAAVYVIALFTPGIAHSGDDGAYLVNAKALAEGRGYRIISSPHELHQTKYPIIFPAMLACVWKLFPVFPDNSVYLKLVPLGTALLWFVLIRRLAADLKSEWLTNWLPFLVAAAPFTVFLSTSVLSDVPYAMFSTAALIAVHRAESASTIWPIVGAAVLGSAAYNTRTTGVAVIMAGVLLLLFRRNYKRLAVFTGVCGTMCLPWLLWQINHRAVAAVDGYNSWLPYYRSWNIILNFTLTEKLTVVMDNMVYLVIAPSWVFGLPYNPLVAMVCMLIAVLMAIGFIADLKRGVTVFHVYIVIYHLMVLVWAFPPFRFLPAILPFMLLYFFNGVRIVFWGDGSSRAACYGLAPVLAFRLISQSLLASHLGVIVIPGSGSYPNQSRWADFVEAMHDVSSLTSEHARLLGTMDSAFYLYTNRTAIAAFENDPLDVYLPGRDLTSDRVRALQKLIGTESITDIVETPYTTPMQSAVFKAFKAQFPSRICQDVRISSGYRLISLDSSGCPSTR